MHRQFSRTLTRALLLSVFLAPAAASAADPGDDYAPYVDLLGWSKDGSRLAWTETWSTNDVDGTPLQSHVVLVVADADGKPVERYRKEAELDPSIQREPKDWKTIKSEQEAKAWLDANAPSGATDTSMTQPKQQVTWGKASLEMTQAETKGAGSCKALSLSVGLAGAKAEPLLTESCLPAKVLHRTSSWRSAVSPDGRRVAVAWNLTLFTQGASKQSRTAARVGVLDTRALATIDLLDAGAGPAAAKLAKDLEGAGFKVAHQGPAKAARAKTEVYFAPGFEPLAREVARLAGAEADAVKPLSWKSPFAITVAAAK